MSRQINLDIFNEGYIPTKTQDLLVAEDLSADRPDPRVDDVVGKMDKTRYEVQEWIKSLNLRLEKAMQRLQALEERFNGSQRENHDRMATLYSRIKENHNSEFKFAALIERHNQIVQSFELRLTQAQRMIENQAVQMAKQQDLIDDARRHIEKLKKL